MQTCVDHLDPIWTLCKSLGLFLYSTIGWSLCELAQKSVVYHYMLEFSSFEIGPQNLILLVSKHVTRYTFPRALRYIMGRAPGIEYACRVLWLLEFSIPPRFAV